MSKKTDSLLISYGAVSLSSLLAKACRNCLQQNCKVQMKVAPNKQVNEFYKCQFLVSRHLDALTMNANYLLTLNKLAKNYHNYLAVTDVNYCSSLLLPKR